ncbi:MAG: (2Fe-2S)-binding protein [Hyphomicrobium sp.]
MIINGQETQITSDPETPLLWVLRDELKLMGAKYGCGAGLCGACTVLSDGNPIRSCLTSVGSVGTKKIITPEGLQGPISDIVRQAWIKHDVAQCGFCQSGQIMAATVLLQKTKAPTQSQINETMSPYLCRCATYTRIRQALQTATKTLKT